MSLQPFIKRGTRSNATARRLIASTSIAPHVLAATFHDERIKKPMIRCKATEAFRKGAVEVKVNETFYLVASKFIGYFYVITQDGRCSSSDERVAQRCQAMVAAKAAWKKGEGGVVHSTLGGTTMFRIGNKVRTSLGYGNDSRKIGPFARPRQTYVG